MTKPLHSSKTRRQNAINRIAPWWSLTLLRSASLRAFAVLCALVILVAPYAVNAQIAQTPRELAHVGVNEHLDGPIPLDTPFRDHMGRPVTLRKYIDGKRPVVLQFAYHTCPVVCSMITNNLSAGLKEVPWTIGDQYDVITISIDPNESLEKTTAKRTSILNDYGRTLSDPAVRTQDHGWHFLVGDAQAIAAVTSAVGFEYQYDERQKQWGHPSVVFIVKPNGHLARYLYGLEFPPNDLRLGLLEASEGRHISTVEKLILYCYHYDPQGGKYVLVARRVMQVGAGGVAIILFSVLGMFWARELRRKNKRSSSSSSPSMAKTEEEQDNKSNKEDSSEPSSPSNNLGDAHPVTARGG